MTFVHMPNDGWPTVVDAEPGPNRISDLLGGAIPVQMGLSAKAGIMVREDCRDMPLNPAATYVASMISQGVVPVLGPAVFVMLKPEIVVGMGTTDPDGDRRLVLGDVVSLPRELADTMARMGSDALCASNGDDRLLKPSPKVTRAQHAEALRSLLAFAEECREEFPADYPEAVYQRADVDRPTTADGPFYV